MTTLNVNESWKNLDLIFQVQLKKHVLLDNKHKFNALTEELGFTNVQKEILFDALQTFTLQCSFISTPQTALYAIPTNKNEKLSGRKRKRSELDEMCDDDCDDFDDSLSDGNDKKIQKNLWEHDSENGDNENIFFVDQIIDHKIIGENKYNYNVKWKGYDDCTWEPPLHLNPDTISQYWGYKGFKIDKHGVVSRLNHLIKNRTCTKE
eukprot:UN09565